MVGNLYKTVISVTLNNTKQESDPLQLLDIDELQRVDIVSTYIADVRFNVFIPGGEDKLPLLEGYGSSIQLDIPGAGALSFAVLPEMVKALRGRRFTVFKHGLAIPIGESVQVHLQILRGQLNR